MRRVWFGLIALLIAALGCSLLPAGPVPVPVTPVGPSVTPPPLAGEAVENPQLTSFHMLNEQDGWGVSENAILRTQDGGRTWVDVSPTLSLTLSYGAASSTLDAGHAAILNASETDPMGSGTLHVTRDGGRSWSSSTVPFGNAQLHFFEDMQNGWAMAGLGVGAGSHAIAIYQTADGGATWKQVFTNLPTDPNAAEGIPMGGLKGVFAARDMQTAWVGGVVYSDNTSYLYRTDDGGRNWRQVELPGPKDNPAQWSIETLQFVTEETGFLSMQISGEASYRAVYVTRDGGETWDLTPTLIPNGRAADFVSETEGFVFDGETFHVTQDAGQTWTSVPPDLVFSENFISMDFVNAQTGWVTASDPTTFAIHVYQTTDGGRTWNPQ